MERICFKNSDCQHKKGSLLFLEVYKAAKIFLARTGVSNWYISFILHAWWHFKGRKFELRTQKILKILKLLVITIFFFFSWLIYVQDLTFYFKGNIFFLRCMMTWWHFTEEKIVTCNAYAWHFQKKYSFIIHVPKFV